MIGLKRGTVDVVPYAWDWVPAFQSEALLLQKTLGPTALAIEHIGSTAISGMPAKPIIDFMVAVANLSQSRQLIPLLEDVGYNYRPHDCVQDRHFFAKGKHGERTHHLSLAETDSTFWQRQVAFRDHMRTDQQAATLYAELKMELASKYSNDRNAYIDAKEPFVLGILRQLGSTNLHRDRNSLHGTSVPRAPTRTVPKVAVPSSPRLRRTSRLVGQDQVQGKTRLNDGHGLLGMRSKPV